MTDRSQAQARRSLRSEVARRLVRRLSDSPEIGIVLALIVTFTAFTIKNPLFASVSDLQSPLGIDLAGFGILAIGESLTIITGGIDLSVGSLVAFFVVFSAWLNASMGIPVVFAFILTILFGIGWGLWHGFLITKLGVPPFVATLVTFIFAVGADEAIAPNPISIGSKTFLNVTGSNVGGVPIPVILFLIIAISAWIFLERTYIGRQLYAVGGNREAARLAGIRIDRRIVLAYAVSGGCAALVGIIEASRLTSGTADSVSGWELIAIASAVIGGVSLVGGQGRIIGIVSGRGPAGRPPGRAGGDQRQRVLPADGRRGSAARRDPRRPPARQAVEHASRVVARPDRQRPHQPRRSSPRLHRSRSRPVRPS